MKKLTAAILAFVLTAALFGCAAKEEDKSRQASDAFDRYNEAIVRLTESGAFDVTIYADLSLGGGNSFNTSFDYQYKDTGADCEYYEKNVFSSVYYSEGVKTTVMGDNEVRENVTYEEMKESAQNAVSMLSSFEITREDFEKAEIEKRDDLTSVTFKRSGELSVPEAFAGYAALLGFDENEVTDIVYDDAEFTLEYSEETGLEYAGLSTGVSYTNAEGEPSVFRLNADFYVNAVGDSVKVKKYY